MTLRKKVVQWHEEGLKNKKEYLERELQVLEDHKAKVQRLIESVDKTTKQIAFAKSKKMTEFDEESKVFMIIG